MKIDLEKPFNDLPLLPPNVQLESIPILKQLAKSHKALAELIPNKDILINSIILKEAKIGSEIENIVTTHDSIYLNC